MFLGSALLRHLAGSLFARGRAVLYCLMPGWHGRLPRPPRRQLGLGNAGITE
jgi:hypothetical protein